VPIPDDRAQLRVTLTLEEGDADLLLRHGEAATAEEFSCIARAYGERAECEVPGPEPGFWFVRIDAATWCGPGILEVGSDPDDPDPSVHECSPPEEGSRRAGDPEGGYSEDLDPRYFAEAETWVDLDAMADLSETPIFVRVLEEVGTVSSIHGTFTGGEAFEVFEQVLMAGGLGFEPDEWLELGEGPHGPDDRYSVLTLERHSAYGIPVAGGTVNLIFDHDGLYAIEGRLAGELPEVDPAEVSAEELEHQWDGFSAEGPFLYLPEVYRLPDVDLGDWPMAIFTLAGPEGGMIVDGYGSVLWSEQVEELSEMARVAYELWVLGQPEPWQVCADRALRLGWNTGSVRLLVRKFTQEGPGPPKQCSTPGIMNRRTSAAAVSSWARTSS